MTGRVTMLCAVPLALGAWIAWTIAKADTVAPSGGQEVVRSESIRSLWPRVAIIEKVLAGRGETPVSRMLSLGYKQVGANRSNAFLVLEDRP